MVKVVSIIEPKGRDVLHGFLSCQANISDCLRGTFEADEADTIIPTINRAGLL